MTGVNKLPAGLRACFLGFNSNKLDGLSLNMAGPVNTVKKVMSVLALIEGTKIA